jgi:hypothetical protein
MILVGLHIPEFSAGPAVIEFVLDTGASRTSLHPTDAITTIGIDRDTLDQPPNTWPPPEASNGRNGAVDYCEFPCTYYLLDEASGFSVFDESIRIAHLTAGNERIPSLLGWDVLKKFTVEINHAAGLVYLL